MSEATQRASDVPLPGGDFRLFVTRLAFQGLLSLGLLENPVTKRRDKNPQLAQAMIDDLKMLREKTLGNLDADEAAHLGKAISDLEAAFAKL